MRNFFKDNPFICSVYILNMIDYSIIFDNPITKEVMISFKCAHFRYPTVKQFISKTGKMVLLNFTNIFRSFEITNFLMSEERKRFTNKDYDFSEYSMLKFIESNLLNDSSFDTIENTESMDVKSLFNYIDKFFKNEI